ncbi:hypothetical protein CEXT_310021 [Caerostris extrusa]|uniref:Uncharacterized protein n=1 Tax=Caerostris extrusa TaxID=172846 RepID=A0AAV4P7F0_CAEEX|nr:hypothetical protein CEXT_310021 [Caerostris extrusa]
MCKSISIEEKHFITSSGAAKIDANTNNNHFKPCKARKVRFFHNSSKVSAETVDFLPINPVRFQWAGFLKRSNSARKPLPSFRGPGFMGLALWPIFQRGPWRSLNLG